MFRWINSFFKQILVALSNFSDLLDLMLRLPTQRPDEDEPPSRVKNVLLWPFKALAFLVAIIGKTLLFPVQLFANIFKASKRDALLCLPSIIAIALMIFVLVRVGTSGKQILNQYRAGARNALQNEDFELAKTYFGRIMTIRGGADDSDKINWAIALDKTGESIQAANIINRLAPDDKKGSPLAHRIKALNLVQQLGRKEQRPDLLEQLRWHLDAAGPPQDVAMNQAWAFYYMAIGEEGDALPYLELAAKVDARNLITVADIMKRNGNGPGSRRVLNEAVSAFRNRLRQKPTEHQSRVLLANALVKLDRIDEAERELAKGMALKEDPLIKRAFADFQLMRYDKLVQQAITDFDQQLQLLKRALDLDPYYASTYERMIQNFLRVEDGEKADEIKEFLRELIAKGESIALAHFALGNMLVVEGKNEEALWHMRQAYEIDESLLVGANNFAWLLADKENPDLEQALTIAKGVVEKAPDDPRFRDTLGTVLLKQGKYEEALTELEKTLQTIRDKKPVHAKLAEIYEKLGKPEMAELHRQ